MPAYIIATSACRLCIDYIQQQCVCVFVPFILATSPSDQGETFHFAVYLEDYTLVQCIFLFNLVVRQVETKPWDKLGPPVDPDAEPLPGVS